MSAALLVVSVDLLGMAVGVEVADGEAAAHVGKLMGGLAPSRGPSQRTLRLVRQGRGFPGWELYDGDHLVRGHMSGAEAVRTLMWYLNHLALRTRDYAVLHAGAVAWQGRGVVLPAEMDVGKSTLVTALVGDGFGYLSDEFAPIGLDDGLVYAYPSPIGLDPGSFPLFPELKPELATEFDDPTHWYVPTAPEPVSARQGLTPAAVVFPSYVPGAPCCLTRLDPKAALVMAANNTVNLFDLGGRVFRALSTMVRRAPAYQLVFSGLAEASAAVRGVVVEGAR